MRTIELPRAGLHASVLGLGTAGFGTVIPTATAFRLLDAFTAGGGTLVDTALVYANWLPGEPSASEKVIGRWLRDRGRPPGLVLATKGGHPEIGDMARPRLHRAALRADVDASRRHLRSDVIDFFWLHRDDPARPVDDILATMERLIDDGVIRAYGCSNWSLARIRAFQATAAAAGRPGFAANQIWWSLAYLRPERLPDPGLVRMDADLLAYHAARRWPAVAYTPLAAGLFHKLARWWRPRRIGRHYWHVENWRRYRRARRLARRRGVSLSVVILGYLLSRPFPTAVLVGCRTPAQMQDSLAAVGASLAVDELAYLDG